MEKTQVGYNQSANKQAKEIFRLMEELRQSLPFLRDKYHVETLEVFGSYVRSEQRKTSDLDLLVTFSQLPSLLTFIELENNISDRLGVKVDLVLKDSLKPEIGSYILREAITV
jgi:predicted nucleotidyltransferase